MQATVVNNDAFVSFNNFLKNMKGKASSISGVVAGDNGLGVIYNRSDASSLSSLESPSSAVLWTSKQSSSVSLFEALPLIEAV